MAIKKKILITGGAGFVGTNLIKLLLKKTNYTIISLDNYSSGSKKNHIKNKRVRYIKGQTVDIEKIIRKPKELNSIFHFGEFARIYQSFLKMNKCIQSNNVGSNAVFNFCLKINFYLFCNPPTLGNNGKDKNLSVILFLKLKISNYRKSKKVV